MPPVIAAAAAIYAGVGAAGLALTGSAIGMAAAQGALIGALIGAATAAVTGGDIGEGIWKGALFGAVTGGVMQGISGAAVPDSVAQFSATAGDKGVMAAMSESYGNTITSMAGQVGQAGQASTMLQSPSGTTTLSPPSGFTTPPLDPTVAGGINREGLTMGVKGIQSTPAVSTAKPLLNAPAASAPSGNYDVIAAMDRNAATAAQATKDAAKYNALAEGATKMGSALLLPDEPELPEDRQLTFSSDRTGNRRFSKYNKVRV